MRLPAHMLSHPFSCVCVYGVESCRRLKRRGEEVDAGEEESGEAAVQLPERQQNVGCEQGREDVLRPMCAMCFLKTLSNRRVGNEPLQAGWQPWHDVREHLGYAAPE